MSVQGALGCVCGPLARLPSKHPPKKGNTHKPKS